MTNGKSLVKKILFFALWIFFSFLSIMIAYWCVGAISPDIYGASYGDRLLKILKEPFGIYFTDYSVAAMILAFLINEIIFGFIFITKFISAPSELSDEEINAWIDKVNEDDEVAERTKKEVMKRIESELNSSDNFDNFETSSVEKSSVDVSKKNGKESKKKEDEEKEFVINDDMFLNMFNAGYDMGQINAMMELTHYIPEIDDVQLKKMFKPSMTEDEIRDYIEVFYG